MIDGLIKLKKVQELTSFSRATIYRQMEKGEFPKKINLTDRKIYWVEEEVRDYITDRIQNRFI